MLGTMSYSENTGSFYFEFKNNKFESRGYLSLHILDQSCEYEIKNIGCANDIREIELEKDILTFFIPVRNYLGILQKDDEDKPVIILHFEQLIKGHHISISEMVMKLSLHQATDASCEPGFITNLFMSVVKIEK